MSYVLEFLKDRPELNISAISRLAEIKGNKLRQAISGVEHKPGYVRTLTGEEEHRVVNVLKSLAKDISTLKD